MITPQAVAAAGLDLGAQLAAFRHAVGLSQHDLAKLVFLHRSSIANIERGRQVSHRDFWERCDDLLHADGALVAAYERYRTIQAARYRPDSSLPDILRQPQALLSAADRQVTLAAAHTDHVASTDIANVEEMVKRIAGEYLHRPPMQLYQQGRLLADNIFDRILATGSRSARPRELHLWAGYLGALLGWVAGDLGDTVEASAQIRRGWLHAELADDDTLRAWVLSTMSKIVLWEGRHYAAAELAARGLRCSGRGTVARLLACQQADAWAEYGSVSFAQQALALLNIAREQPGSDIVGGLLSCGLYRQHNYVGSVQLRIGDPGAAAATAAIAIEEVEGTELPVGHGTVAQVRIWSARARVETNQIDAAAELLAPVLATPPAHQLGTVARRIHEVGRLIASRGTLQQDPTAIELVKAIDQYSGLVSDQRRRPDPSNAKERPLDVDRPHRPRP